MSDTEAATTSPESSKSSTSAKKTTKKTTKAAKPETVAKSSVDATGDAPELSNAASSGNAPDLPKAVGTPTEERQAVQTETKKPVKVLGTFGDVTGLETIDFLHEIRRQVAGLQRIINPETGIRFEISRIHTANGTTVRSLNFYDVGAAIRIAVEELSNNSYGGQNTPRVLASFTVMNYQTVETQFVYEHLMGYNSINNMKSAMGTVDLLVESLKL